MNASLPCDSALPQLATAIDGAAMAAVFGAALDGAQLLRCDVDRIKYRPTRDCSVSYRLLLQDARRGRYEQRVSARFCSGGNAAHRHAKARSRTWVDSPAGPAMLHWPALDMIAFWAPNDLKLDALRLLSDDAELRRRSLDEVVTALAGRQARLLDHQSTLVQGVPELRVCARITLRIVPVPGAAPIVHTLYAKADRERNGATVHAAMSALFDSPAQWQGRLRTPRPLLYQPDTGLHWQLAVPGRPMDAQVGVDASAAVGEQLAALHATPVHAVALLDTARMRAQLQSAGAMLGKAEPSWQPTLGRLLGRLDETAASLDGHVDATLHGDLHPGNILVDASGLTLVDFDSLQRGPAVFELGAWVAYLLGRAVLDSTPMSAAGCAARAFLNAYAHGSGQPIDSSLLAWSTAHHLLCRRACGGLSTLKPGRFDAVPTLLALSEAIARAGTIDVAFDVPLEAA